ncbi:NADH/ubiquinone/plastoquinone (complex I), partial [Cellulomonas bogoriensis 69B4 = DSM 16987]
MNAILWLAPVLTPVLVAVVLHLRPGHHASWLLALAPAPAGVLAVVGGVLPAPDLSWLLLGAELALDDVTRLLLLLTAVVWSVAGACSRGGPERRRGYTLLWLLALTGNVGLLVAGDVLTFYTSFAVMTFAAYGLVVHTRTPAARRAGRVYMVLALVGETALLAGLMLAVTEAGAVRTVDVAAAVAASPRQDLLVLLLLLGLGIKAGVFGLHVWLPLAHPAAPFPASAALSGSMIKAGLAGWVHLLPVGQVALTGWSDVVVALGVVTAFAGVLLGLAQRDPKVVLAYSSVSQMGFVTVLVGVALRDVQVAPLAVAGAAVYALHHGLAKAALFLGTGLVRRVPVGTGRTVLLVGSAFAAASLAGAPATSGAAAKSWLKGALDLVARGDGIGLAMAFAATGTTVLMVRFMALLVAVPAADGPRAAGRGVLVPWTALLGAVATVTAVLPARLLVTLEVPAAQLVRDSVWPVALGLALAGVAWLVDRRHPVAVPPLPAGDLVVVGEGAVTATGRALGGARARA